MMTLLEAGADVNAETTSGETPLARALAPSPDRLPEDTENAVGILLAAGACLSCRPLRVLRLNEWRRACCTNEATAGCRSWWPLAVPLLLLQAARCPLARASPVPF